MAERVDLDKTLALLADAGMPDEECDPDAYIAAALQDAKDMVAELRVAREVIAAARWIHDELLARMHPGDYHDCVLCHALAAHDRQVDT